VGEYRHFEAPAQRLVKRQNPVKSGFARLRMRPLAVAIDGGVTMSPFDEPAPGMATAWPVQLVSLLCSSFAVARKIEAPLPLA
jgi:hypothetical protein